MNCSRIPGPMGSSSNTPVIDSGTLVCSASPLPGITGQNQKDAEIEALRLAPIASTAAYLLKKAHPSVKFTSGRRSIQSQAHAMAGNVVKNRKWIEQTYKHSPLIKKLQGWVDNNPDKKTQKEVMQGLMSVFNDSTDAEVSTISKHLTGMAFDVQPVFKDAEKIKKTIRKLSGLDKFLDKEGGLVRWHAQFKART